MKRSIVQFAMLALVPAAFNLAGPAAGGTMMMPLCTGDGVVRMVEVPLGGSQLPGPDQSSCCVKGCHSGCSRKRSGKPGDSPEI
ncbi:hypothetical protein [Novosphingobium sp.]|uniref:hypothetical protein n=1 Tax=Novosphingobium sp. TaxID=1874826 RepID=UPI002736EEFC|nr:hypothetical protein [Novosphingobium sp.]MDP3908423.1 hypothetical protein [Novosphingobium sp.]